MPVEVERMRYIIKGFSDCILQVCLSGVQFNVDMRGSVRNLFDRNKNDE